MAAREASGIAQPIGRYVVRDEIASGGMATVHLGRMLGPAGFARTVAIKRLHPHFAKDPEFVSMFLDEARLAARIQHPNVVSTLDVVARDRELFLVMDYITGESLSRLLRVERPPFQVTLSVMIGVLYGLHAAHEATNERSEPLGIIHRDVSPQNILIGTDGAARILDFGIAKAAFRLQSTREGQVKGKMRYLSPEQLTQGHLDRRADVYAASVVLWEVLTGAPLFTGNDPGALVTQILNSKLVPPSHKVPSLPRSIDAVVMRGLARNPETRFATALAFAKALEGIDRPASQSDVGEWVARTAGASLKDRAARVAALEMTDPLAGEAAAAAVITAVRRVSVPETPARTGHPERARDAGQSGDHVIEPSAKGVDGTDAQLTTDGSVPQAHGSKMRANVRSIAATLGIAAVLATGLIVTRALVRKADFEHTVAAPATFALAAPVPPTYENAQQVDSADSPTASGNPLPAFSPPPSASSSAAWSRSGASLSSKVAPTPPPRRRGHGTGSASAAVVRSNCDPPFTIDPDGAKRYKPECL